MITRAVFLFLLAIVSFGPALGQTGNGSERRIRFNGRPLTTPQRVRVEMLERYYGVRLPDNDYWYDNRSGAMGFWGGPAAAALPAGLELGGPMPADCSGGRTGVFLNGREIHPMDVAGLSQLLTVLPGRYWVDSNGNFGYERGPAVGNLFVLARARSPRSGIQHRVYAPGELSGLFGNSAGYCTKEGTCAYPSR